MTGGAGQPLFGTKGMRNTHFHIIDDCRQPIRGKTVRLHQHMVVVIGVLPGDHAADRVIERGLTLGGHGKAYHERRTARFVARPLIGIKKPAPPVIAGGLTTPPLLRPQIIQALFGAVATVGTPRR